MLTQSTWRRAGAVTILACAAMAWYGVKWPALRQSLVFFVIYWGVFLLLLAVSLYIVVLDIRCIRMQYAVGKREVFRQTIGSEEFRRALREALEKARRNTPPEQQQPDPRSDSPD
jgi:hypothetical protein